MQLGLTAAMMAAADARLAPTSGARRRVAVVMGNTLAGAGQSADGLAGAPGAVVLTGAGSAFSAGVDLFRVIEGGEAYVATLLPARMDADW